MEDGIWWAEAQDRCPACGVGKYESHRLSCPEALRGLGAAGMQQQYPNVAQFLTDPRAPMLFEDKGDDHDAHVKAYAKALGSMQQVALAEASISASNLYRRLKTGPWLSRLWSWLREFPLPDSAKS